MDAPILLTRSTVIGRGSICQLRASLHQVFHLASCGPLVVLENLSFSSATREELEQLEEAAVRAMSSLAALTGLVFRTTGKSARFKGPVREDPVGGPEDGTYGIVGTPRCHRCTTACIMIGTSSVHNAIWISSQLAWRAWVGVISFILQKVGKARWQQSVLKHCTSPWDESSSDVASGMAGLLNLFHIVF